MGWRLAKCESAADQMLASFGVINNAPVIPKFA
jgi:hypothetical protein